MTKDSGLSSWVKYAPIQAMKDQQLHEAGYSDKDIEQLEKEFEKRKKGC